MKLFTTIFLVYLVTSPLCLQIGIIVNWKINQSYISKTYCVNRYKPMLHCNGKCQLGKMLQKQEEEKNKANEYPTHKLATISIDCFQFNNISTLDLNLISKSGNQKVIKRSIFVINSDFRNSIFQPPEKLV